MTKALAIAGDKYATYLCDKCDQPIGPDGTVQLTTVTPVLVWGCHCRACRPRPDYDPKVDHPERYTDGPI